MRGLAAVLINNNFERDLIILELKRLIGSHSVDNTKEIIERIVNQYDFDKRKIKVSNLSVVYNC